MLYVSFLLFQVKRKFCIPAEEGNEPPVCPVVWFRVPEKSHSQNALSVLGMVLTTRIQ